MPSKPLAYISGNAHHNAVTFWNDQTDWIYAVGADLHFVRFTISDDKRDYLVSPSGVVKMVLASDIRRVLSIDDAIDTMVALRQGLEDGEFVSFTLDELDVSTSSPT